MKKILTLILASSIGVIIPSQLAGTTPSTKASTLNLFNIFRIIGTACLPLGYKLAENVTLRERIKANFSAKNIPASFLKSFIRAHTNLLAHESGHGLSHYWLTDEKFRIYIGTHAPEQNPSLFNIGGIYFHGFDPVKGLCRKENTGQKSTTHGRIFCLAAGPIGGLISNFLMKTIINKKISTELDAYDMGQLLQLVPYKISDKQVSDGYQILENLFPEINQLPEQFFQGIYFTALTGIYYMETQKLLSLFKDKVLSLRDKIAISLIAFFNLSFYGFYEISLKSNSAPNQIE